MFSVSAYEFGRGREGGGGGEGGRGVGGRFTHGQFSLLLTNGGGLIVLMIDQAQICHVCVLLFLGSFSTVKYEGAKFCFCIKATEKCVLSPMQLASEKEPGTDSITAALQIPPP